MLLFWVSRIYHLAWRVLAFWHLGGHFGRLGTPWGTIGPAGWTRGGPESQIERSRADFGPDLESFFRADRLDSVSLQA